MISKSSLFKIEYSINIETQCLKSIQLYSKPHFHIFTRKKGPLPLLPESPSDASKSDSSDSSNIDGSNSDNSKGDSSNCESSNSDCSYSDSSNY